MIRTTRKNDTVSASTNHLFKSSFSGFLSILTEFFLFFPGGFHSILNLLFRKSREFWQKLFAKTFCKTSLIINRKERIHIYNRRILTKFINVIAQNFRITCYDWTVIVISSPGIFLLFIRSTRIENEFTAPLNQRNYMTVTDFSWIADRFRRNCFNTFFIHSL